ncbi:MAG TPA: hypothetical protein VFX76_08105, partial [Roseiflexaceae bacterium]|nr:hypothetical protein [Roseiflexaceae bacterium]
TTILLSVDADTGALHEIRELIGPAGGERVTRTTWRFVADEWLDDPAVVETAFDIEHAWNGAGDFERQADPPVDPALPLDSAAELASLPQLQQSSPLFWLPAAPPPGATRALLLAEPGNIAYAMHYLGTGRRLSIYSTTNFQIGDAQPLAGERLLQNGNPLVLQALNAQGYRALLRYRGAHDAQVQTIISSSGYTRAELLAVIDGFGPPTTASFRAQAGLFANPHPTEQAALDALLAALETPIPPEGRIRHFVERTFTRHRAEPDLLRDPYHLPPYGGRSETMQIENWTHQTAQGRLESGNREQDDRGTIFARQYLGPETTWYYDAPSLHAALVRSADLPLGNTINLDQAIVLDLLGRGGSRLLTLPDGTRVISHSQPLAETNYAGMLQDQQQIPDASGPYLAGVAGDATITTQIILASNGRPKIIERWASNPGPAQSSAAPASATSAPSRQLPQNTVLLETWELADDQLVSIDQVPAGTFDQTPPDALSVRDEISAPA